MTKCSLIVIGSELTRGIIADKHGQLVSREMTHIGVHMSQIVALPDDGSITSVLHALKKSNDIIIVTGGLGPTQDDMTRRCIADVFGTFDKRWSSGLDFFCCLSKFELKCVKL